MIATFRSLSLVVAFFLVPYQQPSAVLPPAQPASVAPGAVPAAEVAGVEVVAVLRSELTSKSAHEGEPIKLALRTAVTLPDGHALPKGALLIGRVTRASPHQKGKPNGALMLLVETAVLKDGVTLPLAIEIMRLEPSVESQTTRSTLPSNNGGRLGGTTNSGGGEQLLGEVSEAPGLKSNVRNSGLSGIYLRRAAGSSGVVFAVNGDVFLDAGTQFMLRVQAPKLQ